MKDYDYGYEFGRQVAREQKKEQARHNELSSHKKSDQIKWIVTAVAFLLVFVLIGSLFALLLRSKGGEDEKPTEPVPTVKVQTKLLSFNDLEKRTSYSELKQVWEDNGIVFTNLKGTGSNVGDYYNPIRLYTHSTLMVECADMTRVVFYCISSTHIGNLRDSIDESEMTVLVNNNDVTLEFDKAVDKLEITDLIGQVQLSQIAVTAPFPIQSDDAELPEEDEESGGMVVEQSTNVGIALMSTAIAVEDFEQYGVSALADSAYTLTATISPSDANNQLVDWAVNWKNASSTWAKGKTVTNYVTVATESDGAATATVSCLEPFGEQIEISVTSRDNPNAKAVCRADYMQRLKSVTFKLGNFAILSNYDFESYAEAPKVKMEIGNNVQGTGGAVNVSCQGTDVYTVKENFSITVDMTKYTYSSAEFYQPLYNDNVKYGVELPIDITNSSVYFDRSLMTQLGLNVYLSHGGYTLASCDVSTLAAMYDKWSPQCDWIVYFIVHVKGTYSNKDIFCYAKYDGYVNSTPVSSVSLGETSLSF